MKVSRYNIYDEDNFYYIANTLTGAHIQTTEEEIFKVKNEKFQEFNIDELDILKENGIIVDSELDETQLIRNAYNYCKYTNKKATVTIALSLDCNFDCTYCYENKNRQCMSENIQNQVVIFVSSIISNNHLSELHVCWYGGEPTLHMNIIQKISDKIIDFCKETGVKYHASIITNGYLVNEKIIDVFQKCFIESAQVTLDGTKKTHNRRRKLIDGSGTYDKIKKAVFCLAENKINVAIRVNLDKSNIHEYKDVYDVFAGKPNINCYPAIVTIEQTQNTCQQSLCYANAEFNEFYKTIFEDMYENKERKFDISLQPEICNCAAEHAYSYLIAPDGYLYKCLNDIGNRDYAVGHVLKDISGTWATAKYLGRDPFTEPECQECPYIPVCYGGCVYEYRKHNTHACNAMRFMYKKYYQQMVGGEGYEGNY